MVEQKRNGARIDCNINRVITLAGSGVYELKRGVARDKYGNEIRRGLGKTVSILRASFGSTANSLWY